MVKKVIKRGRKTKIQSFIKAAEKILSNQDIVLLTDEELFFAVNQELPLKNKIDMRTFQNWKEKYMSNKFSEIDENGKDFFKILKKAIIIQKKNLYKKLISDNIWQRWAWIIERKFPELRLTQGTKVDVKKEKSGGELSVSIISYADATSDTSV